jgi:hypothetical protein
MDSPLVGRSIHGERRGVVLRAGGENGPQPDNFNYEERRRWSSAPGRTPRLGPRPYCRRDNPPLTIPPPQPRARARREGGGTHANSSHRLPHTPPLPTTSIRAPISPKIWLRQMLYGEGEQVEMLSCTAYLLALAPMHLGEIEPSKYNMYSKSRFFFVLQASYFQHCFIR